MLDFRNSSAARKRVLRAADGGKLGIRQLDISTKFMEGFDPANDPVLEAALRELRGLLRTICTKGLLAGKVGLEIMSGQVTRFSAESGDYSFLLLKSESQREARDLLDRCERVIQKMADIPSVTIYIVVEYAHYKLTPVSQALPAPTHSGVETVQ